MSGHRQPLQGSREAMDTAIDPRRHAMVIDETHRHGPRQQALYASLRGVRQLPMTHVWRWRNVRDPDRPHPDRGGDE